MALGADYLPIEPIHNFIIHLENLERNPYTIRTYAYHLKLFWDYLADCDLSWNVIQIDSLAYFIHWLRFGGTSDIINFYPEKAKHQTSSINTIIASEFRRLLALRLKKFQLTMHPKKTQLIRFGRYATSQCRAKSLRKPKTFVFLGFTHICSQTRGGAFAIRRLTDKKRMHKKLQDIKQTLMKNRHASVIRQGQWIKRVVQGYYNYHAVPWNMKTLIGFRESVVKYWLKALRRRSQRHRLPWNKYAKLVKLFIPAARRVHDYPEILLTLNTQGRSRMR